MGARNRRNSQGSIVGDVWLLVSEYFAPKEIVFYREICKSTYRAAERQMCDIKFLRKLLEDTCEHPPTGKLLDAFLPGVRMLGPHSPNDASEKLKCKLSVALGFETITSDLLGFTVCGTGTVREFCDNYLPIVWRLCVKGVGTFTQEEKTSFLMTARAIRLVTTRLERTKHITVVRLGKELETHYDIVHQALILSISDTTHPSPPPLAAAARPPRAVASVAPPMATPIVPAAIVFPTHTYVATYLQQAPQAYVFVSPPTQTLYPSHVVTPAYTVL